MCGIIGYIGKRSAVPILVDGLRRMEYRGYDSSGVALLDNQKLMVVKRQGKVEELAKAMDHDHPAKIGIGHTRWATHGEPSERNAHPHQADNIAIVHNGIIENYAELKEVLTKHGATFVSETDTEVLAHLIAHKLKSVNDLPKAVIEALQEVRGTFGLVVTSQDHPDILVAARRGSPLLLGIDDTETFIASDATAIVSHTDRVVYLDDDEIAICRPGSHEIRDLANKERERMVQRLEVSVEAIEKGGYDHFLLKEIMEQPKTVSDILRGRLELENGTSHLGGLNLPPGFFRRQTRFLSIGCGTAYYAGLLGKYLLERLTGLPVDVEYGSEFRYRDPALMSGTVGMIITQSGETADTLASLRELNRRGVPSLGLVNVVGSSVAREVTGGVYLHAGPEISVASTKAFTAQVIAQLLVGLQVARARDLSLIDGQEIVRALEDLPGQIQEVLKLAPQIQKLAKKLAKFNAAMYLGRDSLFPVALEGSHKLKEISYIHAEAYPAGEMKHGANALIDENLMVVYLMPQNALYEKSKSNLQEVLARKGQVVLLTTEGDATEGNLGTIRIPKVSEWTEPLVANIPLQLLAYYIAVERGTNVDQPRNLAKSVTVE
jgi:glutamine---fructose-6-phosphate transaminase (isomerizing)